MFQLLFGRLIVGGKLLPAFGVRCALTFCLVFLLAGAVWSGPAQEYQFNIPRQDVGPALDELATQAGALLLLYPYDAVQSVSSNPVVGTYTVEGALGVLLHDTGFTGGLTEGRVITISQLASKDEEHGMKKNKSATFTQKVAAVFLSIFGASSTTEVLAQDLASNTSEEESKGFGYLEEIIVTANKREQNIHNVAMSLTALGNDEINRRGLVGMEDYLSTVPGVSQQDFGAGQNQIVMRGIAAFEREQATVSVYMGEVPLTNAGLGFSVDTKLVDMERIEILRGPQGTLYGSGAMSGTVRNIPVAPNLQEFEGSVDVGFSTTAEEGGDNNQVVGIVNVPLIEDQLALRVAAYRYDNSGYYKNVAASLPALSVPAADFGATVSNQDDIGSSEYTGVRSSLLWAPTDNLDVTLMYMHQELEQMNGRPMATAGLGEFETATFDFVGVGDGNEYLTDEIDIVNLVVEYDLGWARALSSTSWYDGSNDEAFDFGRAFFMPIASETDTGKDALVQEVRLTTYWDKPYQFTGGVYYEDLERSVDTLWVWGGDRTLVPVPVLGGDPDNMFASEADFFIEQIAVFGEMSYDISDQLELTLGARWFDYDRRDATVTGGGFNGLPVGETLGTDEDFGEQDQSFKANAIYTPNENILVYAQWAQGFRLGKPVVNPLPVNLCDVDGDGRLDGTNVDVNTGGVDSDTLDSYEIGGKFTLLDSRLNISTAIYRIDWNDIPVAVFGDPDVCPFTVEANVGEARSQGIEFESNFYVTENLLVNFGASYVDAELSEDTPLGEKGTRLPNSARSNANIGVDYMFDIAGRPSFVRANYSYQGGFYRDLTQTGDEAGDFGDLDLRAGITFDNVSLELYGNNLTNSAEITYPSFNVGGNFIQRPRTIGFDVGYQF